MMLVTDVVISMYNLIEYSNNYSKTSGILWQFYRDVPAVNNNNGFLILMRVMLLLDRLTLN